MQTMNTEPVISTDNLHFGYSNKSEILTDINLSVDRGSIYGFLGPNGSGKTTTLSLLLGLLQTDRGNIRIFGEDLRKRRVEILRRTGSLIENPSLYGHLNARENIEVYRAIYGASRSRVREALEIVGLTDTGNKPTKRFSLGMKQRLALAIALLPNPELLILDEPTNGLDPAGIIELREVIRSLNQDHGITILVSSHILAEVEKMVSHVGIIVKGKMLFQGTLDQLHLLQQTRTRLLINTSDNFLAAKVLATFQPDHSGDRIAITYQGASQVAQISRALHERSIDIYLLQPEQNDLEKLFIQLTSAQ